MPLKVYVDTYVFGHLFPIDDNLNVSLVILTTCFLMHLNG